MLSAFCLIAPTIYILGSSHKSLTSQENMAMISLMVQIATLIVALAGVFYALRQLVESRRINLDSLASADVSRADYSKAFTKWKEVFYIRPDTETFLCMSEVLIFLEDNTRFAEYIDSVRSRSESNMFSDPKDWILFLYLRAAHNLINENLGVARECVKEIIDFNKAEAVQVLPIRGWSFGEIRSYLARRKAPIEGDCGKVLKNLLSYLEGTLSIVDREQFESGNYLIEIKVPQAAVAE